MDIRKRLINDMGRLKLDDLMEVLQELLDQPVPESKNYDKELKDIKEDVKKLEKEVKELTPCKCDNPADVNGDGKVDEKDLSIVHKGYSKEKKAKKAVKKDK